MGEELGMTNYPFSSLDDVADVEGVRYAEEATAAGVEPEVILAAVRARGRDNARTPMQWDDSPNAGFTAGAPWFPVNPNYRSINAASQIDDPDSVFNHYRALIALRHEEPTVVYGDFTMLLPDDPQVYAFTRRLESTELLVLVNVSGEPAVVELPDGQWADAEVVLGGPDPTLQPAPAQPGTIGLQPWESRVLRRSVDG